MEAKLLVKPFKQNQDLSFEPSAKNIKALLGLKGSSWWVSPTLKDFALAMGDGSENIQLWQRQQRLAPYDVVLLDFEDVYSLNHRYLYQTRIWVVRKHDSFQSIIKQLLWFVRNHQFKIRPYRLEPSFNNPVTLLEYDRHALSQYLNRQTEAVHGRFARLIRALKIQLKVYCLRPNIWVIEP